MVSVGEHSRNLEYAAAIQCSFVMLSDSVAFLLLHPVAIHCC